MKKFEKGSLKAKAWACDGKRVLFDILNMQACANDARPSVVFIGDSITEMFEPCVWLPEYPAILNRGIGGDVIEGVSFRFDWDVVQLLPKVCVMMIGVNNILNLDDIAVDLLAKNGTYDDIFNEIPGITDNLLALFREMAEKCRDNGIRLILCSVTPAPHDLRVGRDYRNFFIDLLNEGLQRITKEFGFDYCDFTCDLKDENGMMRSGLSLDGLHPNTDGYRLMVARLKPILDKNLA